MRIILKKIIFLSKKFESAFGKLCTHIVLYRENVQIRGYRIGGFLNIQNQGKIIIGDSFLANSGKRYNPIGGDTILSIYVSKGAELVIGNNVGISNSTIVCRSSITIKNDVLIGGSCRIYDTDFHAVDYENRVNPFKYDISDKNVRQAPILIKEGAWIGGHCIILKGVTIGKQSIVGAGSVVTKDIPDNEIWGGNPAKFIRNNN